MDVKNGKDTTNYDQRHVKKLGRKKIYFTGKANSAPQIAEKVTGKGITGVVMI